MSKLFDQIWCPVVFPTHHAQTAAAATVMWHSSRFLRTFSRCSYVIAAFSQTCTPSHVLNENADTQKNQNKKISDSKYEYIHLFMRLLTTMLKFWSSTVHSMVRNYHPSSLVLHHHPTHSLPPPFAFTMTQNYHVSSLEHEPHILRTHSATRYHPN